MIAAIHGLLVLPRGDSATKRAGIFYDAGAPPRPLFLDLDTLTPEPLDESRAASGRLIALDRRHAALIASGLAKARKRLRARHAPFADAFTARLTLALRDYRPPRAPHPRRP